MVSGINRIARGSLTSQMLPLCSVNYIERHKKSLMRYHQVVVALNGEKNLLSTVMNFSFNHLFLEMQPIMQTMNYGKLCRQVVNAI